MRFLTSALPLLLSISASAFPYTNTSDVSRYNQGNSTDTTALDACAAKSVFGRYQVKFEPLHWSKPEPNSRAFANIKITSLINGAGDSIVTWRQSVDNHKGPR